MIYTVTAKNDRAPIVNLYDFGTNEEPIVVEHEYFDEEGNEVFTITTPRNLDAVLDNVEGILSYSCEQDESDLLHFAYKEMNNGVGLNVWYNRFDNTWYGCWDGTDNNGLLSESEDMPLEAKTQEAAMAELEAYYHEHDNQ